MSGAGNVRLGSEADQGPDLLECQLCSTFRNPYERDEFASVCLHRHCPFFPRHLDPREWLWITAVDRVS